jgi:hypothetical protein
MESSDRVQLGQLPNFSYGIRLHVLHFVEMAGTLHAGLILVITGQRMLKLQMGEEVSAHGGYLRIHSISNGGQPTRGGPSA